MYKISLVLALSCAIPLAAAPVPGLSNPILSRIDGVTPGVNAEKITRMLWFIQEIHHINGAEIRLNAQGEPDPTVKRNTATHESPFTNLKFKGKKVTLTELVESEKQRDRLSTSEKSELDTVFKLLKDYFIKINSIMIGDALGLEHFMVPLIKEFCEKDNRTNSLLLNWETGNEIEGMKTNVISFKMLHDLATDLIRFNEAMIKSCPKAKKAFKDAHPRAANPITRSR